MHRAHALGLLGLRDKPLATQAEIREAYIRRAKMWHPDCNHDAHNPQREGFALLMMQKINEAYDFLHKNPI